MMDLTKQTREIITDFTPWSVGNPFIAGEAGMDRINFTQQAVMFTKMGFDNTFKVVSMARDQAQELAEKLLDQTPWASREGRTIFNRWGESFKVHRRLYKKVANEWFRKMDEFVARTC